MATYEQIQQCVKVRYGYVPKTCWIAHVKEISGIPLRKAHNRIGIFRKHPCPQNKIASIQECFRHFGMI